MNYFRGGNKNTPQNIVQQNLIVDNPKLCYVEREGAGNVKCGPEFVPRNNGKCGWMRVRPNTKLDYNNRDDGWKYGYFNHRLSSGGSGFESVWNNGVGENMVYGPKEHDNLLMSMDQFYRTDLDNGFVNNMLWNNINYKNSAFDGRKNEKIKIEDVNFGKKMDMGMDVIENTNRCFNCRNNTGGLCRCGNYLCGYKKYAYF